LRKPSTLNLNSQPELVFDVNKNFQNATYVDSVTYKDSYLF
jgi:hypothetical protein